MKIRLFEPADAQPLSHIIVKNLREVLNRDYPAEAITGLLPFFTPEELIAKAVNQYTLVCTVDNQPLGMSALDIDRVRNVFVDPTHHRRGIGQRLMAEIETRARATDQPKMWLMASLFAVPFYKRLGFVTVREEKRKLNGVILLEMEMEKELS